VSVVGGRALALGLRPIPERMRRTAEWVFIIGAALVAIAGDLWSEGPGAEGAVVFLIAVLPGIVTYLAFRTMLASALVSFVPLYFVIGAMTRGRATYVPEIALDRAIPVQPAWMLVYGSLYVFVVILPLLVVRRWEIGRRAMQAFLAVMIVSYVGFLLYPVAAPRPAQMPVGGFLSWTLRLAYALDTPYGCFPSLHVAYSFVSALTCYRVHKGVGIGAAAWASLIGLSTLFTKQHYAVDVVAGAALALVAYAVFLRGVPRELVTASDHRRARRGALAVVALYGVVVAGFWVLYRTGIVVV
jgi:membrane-associated phospholipid phosphatase